LWPNDYKLRARWMFGRDEQFMRRVSLKRYLDEPVRINATFFATTHPRNACAPNEDNSPW
jgi:hypothetical protein